MSKASSAPRNKGAQTLARRLFTRNKTEKRETLQGHHRTITTAERLHGFRLEDPSPDSSSAGHHQAVPDAVQDDDGFVHVTRGGAKSVAAQQKKDRLQDARDVVGEVTSISKSKRTQADWDRMNEANRIVRDYENQKRRYKASEARQNKSRASSAVRVGRNGSTLGGQTRMHGITPSRQLIGVVTYHKGVHRIEADIHNPVDQNDKNLIMDPNGIWWRTKPRFWIIVGHHYDQITEVPILSYSNTGLKYIPQGKHCEYLNLEPLAAPNQNTWEKQVQSMPTLKIGINDGGRKVDRLTSVVHFTAATTRPLNCDELEICGSLDKESARVLLYHCKNTLGRKYREDKDTATSALEK